MGSNLTKKGKPKQQPRFSPKKMKKAKRRSRAKTTTPEMQKLIDSAFLDYLTVTVPNSYNGTGERLGIFPIVPGNLTELELYELGKKEEQAASQMLCMWAASQNLRVARIGRGTDKYHGAAHFAFDPTSKVRVATVRAGHSRNMPSMELPGADGECARLALAALSDLGPVNVSRADVTIDCSKPFLWEEADELAIKIAKARNMAAPRYDGNELEGRTVKIGSGEVSLTIYEKSLERLARKKILKNEVDPNLVRVEFSFRPHKAKAKAELGAFLQQENAKGLLANSPGDLLKTSYWVRQFIQGFAQLGFGVTADDAVLGITRLPQKPQPRSCYVSAKRVARQYSRTFCNAAISEIVDQEWQGDWARALVDPMLVADRAIALIKPEIEARAFEMCQFHGTFEAQTLAEEAERSNAMLVRWIERQAELEMKAKRGLREAAQKAAKDFSLYDDPSKTKSTAE